MAIDQTDDCYRRGRIKHINPDGSAVSRVFKPREKDNGKLSVDIKSMTTPELSIKNANEFNLFEISVANVQRLVNRQDENLQIEESPEPDNPAHALIGTIDMDDDITPLLLARASVRVNL